MQEFNAFLSHRENVNLIILVCLSLCVILVILSIILLVGLRKQKRRIDSLLRGEGELNIEDAINSCLNRVQEMVTKAELLECAVGIMQAQIPECIRDVRLARYDAFEDVGGKQSFSLALLDQLGSGIILTGVHSRSDMRLYAKTVKEGTSTHNLIKEEVDLLRYRD